MNFKASVWKSSYGIDVEIRAIIIRVTQIRVVFLRPSHFCNINSTFIGNSHYKSFCHLSFEPTQIFIR